MKNNRVLLSGAKNESWFLTDYDNMFSRPPEEFKTQEEALEYAKANNLTIVDKIVYLKEKR
jgi:hypothetical protein